MTYKYLYTMLLCPGILSFLIGQESQCLPQQLSYDFTNQMEPLSQAQDPGAGIEFKNTTFHSTYTPESDLIVKANWS